jgi:hypothetical protein
MISDKNLGFIVCMISTFFIVLPAIFVYEQFFSELKTVKYCTPSSTSKINLEYKVSFFTCEGMPKKNFQILTKIFEKEIPFSSFFYSTFEIKYYENFLNYGPYEITKITKGEVVLFDRMMAGRGLMFYVNIFGIPFLLMTGLFGFRYGLITIRSQ